MTVFVYLFQPGLDGRQRDKRIFYGEWQPNICLMYMSFNSSLLNSPWTHILTPVLATFFMNAYTLRLYKMQPPPPRVKPWLPPGAVIGAVWTLLFGILGYLHYLLYKRYGFGKGTTAVVFFLLFALAYPIVTSLYPDQVGMWNVVSLIVAFLLALVVTSLSPPLLYWVVPLLVWLSYVNVVFAAFVC